MLVTSSATICQHSIFCLNQGMLSEAASLPSISFYAPKKKVIMILNEGEKIMIFVGELPLCFDTMANIIAVLLLVMFFIYFWNFSMLWMTIAHKQAEAVASFSNFFHCILSLTIVLLTQVGSVLVHSWANSVSSWAGFLLCTRKLS